MNRVRVGEYMSKFIGRKHELEILNRFLKKDSASMLVVRGRRRIGKSRLIEEFAAPYKFYSFAGLAPTDKTTAQIQRDDFVGQMAKQGFPKIQANDWNDIFWALADKVKQGRVIILFDEISWMGSKDDSFLGKIKNVWDLYFKKNPKLIFILCGSASSWVEKNILNSIGFVGRISFTLTLNELPLSDCKKFWRGMAQDISTMEMLKVLSVTGGIPRYLEEIDPKLNAEENIKNTCFTNGAFLVNEFNNIFTNIFLRKSDSYKKIVETLAAGSKEFNEICALLNTENSGRVLEYLDELILAGFVKRDYTWHIQTGKDAKLSRYRISDNYARFYLKYIDKYLTKIARNSFDFKSLSVLPGWEAIIALQFENLVLNNREYIWRKLGINTVDIIAENPFFQHKTTRTPGCQIDYMIQTRFNSLYVCEIKFSNNVVSSSIIDEVRQKMTKLTKPKGFSLRPVLIHANRISDDVVDSDFFANIIDFGRVFDDD
jgi:uncharacterized protein